MLEKLCLTPPGSKKSLKKIWHSIISKLAHKSTTAKQTSAVLLFIYMASLMSYLYVGYIYDYYPFTIFVCVVLWFLLYIITIYTKKRNVNFDVKAYLTIICF